MSTWCVDGPININEVKSRKLNKKNIFLSDFIAFSDWKGKTNVSVFKLLNTFYNTFLFKIMNFKFEKIYKP